MSSPELGSQSLLSWFGMIVAACASWFATTETIFSAPTTPLIHLSQPHAARLHSPTVPGVHPEGEGCAPQEGQGFPLLSSAVQQLLSIHVTSAATKRNWPAWGQLYQSQRRPTSVMVTMMACSKLAYSAQSHDLRMKVFVC